MENSTPKLEYKKLYFWLATWFGCGLMKPAPGTWGSIGALPFAIIIFMAFGFWVFIIATIIVTLIGFWATEQFETHTKTHDNKMIVIDEVVGQWIALAPLFWFTQTSFIGVFLALIFFRIFDVLKPWPVSHFDKNINGALGVMGDDIIAGIFAAGCMMGVIYGGFIT